MFKFFVEDRQLYATFIQVVLPYGLVGVPLYTYRHLSSMFLCLIPLYSVILISKTFYCNDLGSLFSCICVLTASNDSSLG